MDADATPELDPRTQSSGIAGAPYGIVRHASSPSSHGVGRVRHASDA